MKTRSIQFSFILFCLFTLFAVSLAAKDTITEMKVKVTPEKIRPFETAVIRVEFFGTKKKGFLDNLVGGSASKKAKLQSSKWTAVRSTKLGWLSKPFLFQKKGEKTKSGFGNFLKQGLGAASSKDSILFTAPAKPGTYKVKITQGSLTKEVSVVVSKSASGQNGAVKRFPKESASKDPYFPLAVHYAPLVAQETWFNPKADYLARFDYDGNWKGDDNWENLAKGSAQAYVYYAVVESKSHWFLHYNFFHARDYSDICIVGTCHENDNEGMILTVRKDGTKFGKLEVMETLAHNNIYSFSNDKKIKKGVHNIDGKLDLDSKNRPIVFIEAGGHGVLGSGYKKSFFSAKKMDFIKNTGVTYIYKGIAETPKHANDRNVGYALLPIYDHWWSRGNQNSDASNDTFDGFYEYAPYGDRPKASAEFIAGSFKGRTASKNMAKPFWAWHDRRTKSKKVLNTGQWALDPAYAVSKNLKFPKNRPVSTEYVFNPYLAIKPAPKP